MAGNRPPYSSSLSLVGLITGLMVAGDTTTLPPSTASVRSKGATTSGQCMEWSDQVKTRIPSMNVKTGGLVEFALTVLLFGIKACSWTA